MQNALELPDYEPMEWVVDDDYAGMMSMRAMSGQRRDPDTIFRHDFFSGIQLAPHAMELELETEQDGNELVVHTTAINVGANHRVPTGMPIREILLVVEVEPADGGAPLELRTGPTIAPRGGDLAGQPGVVFAKSMGDDAGELTFAFWDATQILEDTRLALGERREDELRFAVDRDVDVTVRARLVYRRASQLLAEQKGWETADQEIGLEEASLPLQLRAVDAGLGPDAGAGEDQPTGCVCRQPGGPAKTQPLALLAVFALLAWLTRRRLGRPA